MIEGARAVESVLRSPLVVEAVLTSDAAGDASERSGKAVNLAAKRGIPVRALTRREKSDWFATRSPQGIAAIAEIPAPAEVAALFAKSRRILILDGVNDPGNVGTLVRTAHLLDWDAVIVTPGTSDPYGDKAARASAGAIGFVSIGRAGAAAIEEAAAANGFVICRGEPGVLGRTDVPSGEKLALVLGGEAEGPVSSWPSSKPVTLPLKRSPVDSLGVAASGAILMHMLRVELSE